MKLHLGESNHTLMAGPVAPVAPVDPVDPVDPPVAAPVELLPVAPVDAPVADDPPMEVPVAPVLPVAPPVASARSVALRASLSAHALTSGLAKACWVADDNSSLAIDVAFSIDAVIGGDSWRMLAEKTGEERRRRPKARVDFMVGGGLGKWYKWYNGEG